MSQRQTWLHSQGDAWFERNQEAVERRGIEDDPLVAVLETVGHCPRRALEIGCGLGQHLVALQHAFGCECQGIEPSRKAVAYCRGKRLNVQRGTAEKLPFPGGTFDLVCFGGSLMYVDPSDLFRVAAEADRVLADPGFLAVIGFQPSGPRRVKSEHDNRLWIYSMDHGLLWTWNPAYVEICRRLVRPDREDRAGIVLLRKSSANAYPQVDRLYERETELEMRHEPPHLPD